MRYDYYNDDFAPADIFKGVLAGVIGGLVASYAMEKFQAATSRAVEKLSSNDEEADAGDRDEGEQLAQDQGQDEPANVKAATAVAKKVFHRRIPAEKKEMAGEIAHYITGGVSGAVYGGLAELSPIVTIGGGTAFGTAVWAIADEVAVPAFGLSKPPTQIPASTHLYALSSHIVYGAVTEVVRSLVRKAI